MSLENFKQQMTTLVIVTLIIAAFVLALNAFRDDMDSSIACTNQSNWYNISSGTCCTNSTSCAAGGTTSIAQNTTTEGLFGVANASSYLSTIGTLIGVAALIAIVIGAFMFVRK